MCRREKGDREKKAKAHKHVIVCPSVASAWCALPKTKLALYSIFLVNNIRNRGVHLSLYICQLLNWLLNKMPFQTGKKLNQKREKSCTCRDDYKWTTFTISTVKEYNLLGSLICKKCKIGNDKMKRAKKIQRKMSTLNGLIHFLSYECACWHSCRRSNLLLEGDVSESLCDDSR